MQPRPAFPAVPGRRLFPVFLVAVFFYWMALYLYVPTLPLFLQSKTADLALIGTALSMYGLWQLIVRLPLGMVVDNFGRRKPFIILWLGLVAAGALLLGNSPNIQTAIYGRALVGISAACWVPLVVMFSNWFAPHELVRATALLAMVGALGRVTATSLNGWLNQLGGYPLAFQLAAGAALLAALIVAFLPDPPTPPRKPSFGTLAALVGRRSIMLPSLLQALLHVADFAATFTFIPILARQMGASDVLISLLLGLNLAISLLGNLSSAWLQPRIGSRFTAAATFTLIAAGLGGAALASSLTGVFAAQLGLGLGFGLGYPLLMGLVTRYAAAAERTTAMGLHQSVYSLGMFTGPWLGGRLAGAYGIPAMFATLAGGILAIGLVGALALQREERLPARQNTEELA